VVGWLDGEPAEHIVLVAQSFTATDRGEAAALLDRWRVKERAGVSKRLRRK
jgi:hypothetical protein